jgi:hypothetical protein
MTTTSHTETQPKKRRLTDIVDELLRAIDDADGEVTARVDALELDLEAKAEAYAAVIARLTAEKAAFKTLVDAYADKMTARDNQIVGLKFRLATAMEQVGVDKLKTPTCSVYFQSSKVVAIEDEGAFVFNAPDAFVVTTHRPNKKAIKEAIESGAAVEGARLVTNRHLQVR